MTKMSEQEINHQRRLIHAEQLKVCSDDFRIIKTVEEIEQYYADPIQTVIKKGEL